MFTIALAPCEVACVGVANCEGLSVDCGEQACQINCSGSSPQGVDLNVADACGIRVGC